VRFQQLRYVVEIVRHGNHLSAAAEALGTAQPGVSREIHLLEQELGFEIFQRSRNRIFGLTEPGETVFSIAQRVTADIGALHALKDNMRNSDKGVLTIATTRIPASYVLPPVIKRFIALYPEVELVLRQGDPDEICELVEAGDADIAIGTHPNRTFANLVKFTCFDLKWCVVAPAGHPILELPELTLEEIVRYPLIGYYARYDGRRQVWKAFADRGLEPRLVISGVDPDLSKAYIRKGMGIGILADITFDKNRDKGIEARDASAVLPSGAITTLIRPSTYLHPFLLDFLQSISPVLTADVLRAGIDNFRGDTDYRRAAELPLLTMP
jgi:LysR family cys regulon transcriptional activator